jgi:polar amino acid transport system substrate-binding protein
MAQPGLWSPAAWLIAALLCPGPALGAKLRMCTDVQPHPPFMMPDGSGSAGEVVAAGALAAGFELEFYAVPLARCRAEAQTNAVHAAPMTPYIPHVLPDVRYPMRFGRPDVTRATMRARIMLFQRVGGPVRWDGKTLAGLDKPVLAPSGSLGMAEALRRVGAPIDERGRSLQANLAKLMAGRGDAAVGVWDEGSVLLALPEFAGKIEMLPLPLHEQAYYLVVTRAFYEEHADQVEIMWNKIGQLNQQRRLLRK